MASTPGFDHFALLRKLQPWLDAVVELYAADGDPSADAAAVRQRCHAAVLATRVTLRDDKLLREKEGDITRTLVALLDEFGARRFSRFGEWASLQIELFHESMLGDDVVAAMEQLCAGRPRDDPERTFVYYLCLALGFQGRYGDANIQSDGDRRRDALRLRLRESLVEAGWFMQSRDDALAPASGSPDGPPSPAPAPRWPWLLAFCVLLTALTEFVVLRHFAHQAAAGVGRQLTQRSTLPSREKP